MPETIDSVLPFTHIVKTFTLLCVIYVDPEYGFGRIGFHSK